uniref:proteasome accessory factor PafA2 family protein n=1 Tax=Nocardiopsis sp. RV163 TaxID=1661388 RepID=UPI000B24985E
MIRWRRGEVRQILPSWPGVVLCAVALEPVAGADRRGRGAAEAGGGVTCRALAYTDLVLRMIEAGVVMRDYTLENPIRAIREVSHDMTGRRKVRLA